MGSRGFARRRVVAVLGAAAMCVAAALGAQPAAAQGETVRISYQFGLGFFPVSVVIEQKLIEKHAKAAGVDSVTVTGVQLNGAAATNDALLSGSIEVAAGGVGGLLQMWDKSGGRVKGLVSLNDMSLLLITNDPSVKTIKDYVGKTDHKIALPAVKVGAHAIVLQMAAEQVLGASRQSELDALTIALPHPEAYAALRGGNSEVKSHFGSLPFTYLELQAKGMHQVLSSYDVLGGPHNNTLLYVMDKWATEKPKMAKAVFDAFVEAHKWINANPKEAAALFLKLGKSSQSQEEVETMITDKRLTQYGPEPLATMKFADFLNKTGRLKTKPAGWKDFFLPIAHGLNGS